MDEKNKTKKKRMNPWLKLALILLALAIMGVVPYTRKIVFLMLPLGVGTLDTLATIAFALFLIIIFFNLFMRWTLNLLLFILTRVKESEENDGEIDIIAKIKKLQEKFN